MVQELLLRNASVNILNSNGMSPLQMGINSDKQK